MNESNVVNPWQVTVVYKCIREHLLVRNLINAINVAKPFHAKLFSCIIEEHIQETNPMNVDNLVKPFHITIVSKYIEEHILEKDPVNVTNVVKTFVWNSQLLTHKIIQTDKKLNVRRVEKHVSHVQMHERNHTVENP